MTDFEKSIVSACCTSIRKTVKSAAMDGGSVYKAMFNYHRGIISYDEMVTRIFKLLSEPQKEEIQPEPEYIEQQDQKPMKINRIEKHVDVFGREFWRIFPPSGEWVEFRCDLYTKQDAIELFRNNYKSLLNRF